MKRSCSLVIELATQPQEQLADLDRVIVAEHCQECAACRSQVVALRALATALREDASRPSQRLTLLTRAAMRRRLSARAELSQAHGLGLAAATSACAITIAYGYSAWLVLAGLLRLPDALLGVISATFWMFAASQFVVAALAVRSASFARPLRYR
jgi:hypothetical protein